MARKWCSWVEVINSIMSLAHIGHENAHKKEEMIHLISRELRKERENNMGLHF